MTSREIVTLFEYKHWANARVLDAAARARPEQFTLDAGLSHRSVRSTLVHILSVEHVWRLRCQEGISPRALLTDTTFPDVGSLRQYLDHEERAMRDYVSTLTDEALDGMVRYTTTQGMAHANVLWQLLVHVVNHRTQFRGEAAVALTQWGQSPGDLDLLLFVRGRSP